MSSELPDEKDEAKRPPAPLPLSYAPADRAAPVTRVFLTLCGAAMSIVVVGFFAAVGFPYPLYRPPGTSVQPVWWAVAMFFVLAALGIGGTALLLAHRPFKQHVWFFTGALIGLGLIGLLEGMCYANP